MQPAINVKTEVFEGPLDLLLTLIEKRKLLINEVSLAKVADDYVEYLKAHPEFPLGETAHFILIASTLVLIKSKSLLPTLDLTQEEQESVEDLEYRLKLYQKFREVGKSMQQLFGEQILYEKSFVRANDPLFTPDQNCTISGLHEAINRTIHNLPKPKEVVPKAVVQKVISLDEMMNRLSERITRAARTSFKEFSGHGKEERHNVVVSFLAMLELVKQGALRVEQSERFSDILMESDGVSTPHYG